jgi:putative ABC transport system permease protein
VTIRDLFFEALDSLAAHRLRALLSVVGIVTGVATIIAALAITGGARRQAQTEIGALGIDNLIIRAVRDAGPWVGGGQGQRRKALTPVLTIADVEALRARFLRPSALPSPAVSALRSVSDTASVSDRMVEVTVAGVTPEWRDTAGLTVSEGRWIDADDLRARTVVLNLSVARVLFGDRSPIGQRIMAAGEWRTIVGVLSSGADRDVHSALQTLDPDRTLFVPLGSLDLSLGAGDSGDAVDEIVVRLSAGTDVARGAPAVSALLAARHPDDKAAYEVIVPQELLRTRLRAERSFHLLLFSIGGLALVISGVGIMNMMVASVTERAAEIGVRRAFGARRSAVIRQFATEAALISAAGGIVGIPLGTAAVVVVAQIAGWPVALSAASVIGSLGLALSVGLAAGVYPAHLAATLSPTDALRQ